MAGTVRTVTAMDALLADNTTGLLSEQDVRDLMYSVIPAYGGLYISASASTAVVAVDTPLIIAGTTVLSASVRDMDMPGNNKLRYTGAATRWFTINVSLSLITVGANKLISFFIAKDTTVDATSEVTHKQLVAADVNLLSATFHMSLATNEYISVWVENTTDGTDLTVNNMVVTAQGIII